jgi:hypothetical protein
MGQTLSSLYIDVHGFDSCHEELVHAVATTEQDALLKVEEFG